jgi:hypothetical protein
MADNTTISLAGIAGIDGVVPVYDPNGLFKTWALNEIFMGTGTLGEARYVPKINDWVADNNGGVVKLYYVADIDVVTLKPTLKELNVLKQDQNLDLIDILLGVGPGNESDTFRVYYNRNVLPHTLTIEGRMHTYTGESERYTIFRGSEQTGNAKPISQQYDQAGNLIGTSIPLALAAVDGQNRTIKSYPGCYTTEELDNGEKLGVIVYSDKGHKVSGAALIVEETSFVPPPDVMNNFIIGITVESPFISPSDPNVLRFPVNIPLNGLSLIGVVHYSNGSKLRMPIDNTKFRLRGFDNFTNTYAGQQFDVLIDYVPSEGEQALGVDTTVNGTITRTYTAITTNYEGMYSPKLFGYPVWQDAVNGYRLEWWLYDMDRRTSILVTPWVKINANSAPFNPTGYGFRQTLGVSINLKDVNPSGLALNHVQSIDIVLRQPGDARTSNWAVGFVPQQEILFGDNNAAKVTIVDQNLMQVDVTCGETVLANWLQRLYRLTYPLTDQGREIKAPDPTHFSIGTASWSVVYPIDQWNKILSSSYTVPNSSTLFVKFLIRTPDTDIQLAVAGLPVYQQ